MNINNIREVEIVATSLMSQQNLVTNSIEVLNDDLALILDGAIMRTAKQNL